jgi:hypothetical protein
MDGQDGQDNNISDFKSDFKQDEDISDFKFEISNFRFEI